MVRQRRDIRTGRTSKQSTHTGYTNELLAAADLNKRCGLAYLNPVHQTEHDAFAKTSLGWKTIQVKTARLLNTRAGISLALRDRRGIKSDIIALIDDQNMRVRYIANGGELPSELPTEATALCRDLIFLNNPEAPNADI